MSNQGSPVEFGRAAPRPAQPGGQRSQYSELNRDHRIVARQEIERLPNLSLGPLLVNGQIGSAGRRRSMAIMSDGPIAKCRLEMANGDCERPAQERGHHPECDPTSGETPRLTKLIQTDPPEHRQAERNPERQPAVIGDVEDG